MGKKLGYKYNDCCGRLMVGSHISVISQPVVSSQKSLQILLDNLPSSLYHILNQVVAKYSMFPCVKEKALMKEDERRKYPRIKTDNLMSYVCLDNDGNGLDQGIGTALDISQGGLLLESHSPVDGNKILLTFVGADNELIEINGDIAYCKETKIGMFQIGVSFYKNDEGIKKAIISMVKAYNIKKKHAVNL